MELIQVNIRPHLVSFLYQELKGESEANYENKKVKLCRICKSSLLGQMLLDFKKEIPQQKIKKISNFSIFLLIEPTEKKGVFHEKVGSNYKILELTPIQSTLINNTLDSIFRISLLEFIKGFSYNNKSRSFVNDAIHQFMVMHNLYDTEIDPETLRSYYYDNKSRGLLYRFQNQVSEKTYYSHIS